MTCICDKSLKHFSLWSSFKNPATSHSSLVPKQQHDTLPTRAPSLLTERKGEKMTAALDLTSNAGERVRKRGEERGKKRFHLCRDSLLEEPGKCRAISLSSSIYPSLPLCVSHQNLPPIRIWASHTLWMGCENTRRTRGVKRRD